MIMKQIIGMVHLKALPMSPNNKLSIEEVFLYAKKDLEELQNNGATSAIIENFGDVPYALTNDRYNLYAMCSIVARLKEIAKIPLGLNIQFNCVEDEVAMATACDLDYVRIEAYVENRAGAFGITEAKAPKVERLRKIYNSNIKVFADANVKHSHPLVQGTSIKESVEEALEAGANAIIVTGIKTGENPKIEDVKEIKKYAKDLPVILGSGINKHNISEYYDYIDGAIVGTSFKYDNDVNKGIDPEKVREFVDVIKNIE